MNMEAKIAGGAHMFGSIVGKEHMDIGKKNQQAVREQLEALGIKCVKEVVGGEVGRTVRFNVEEFEMTIKTKDGGEVF